MRGLHSIISYKYPQLSGKCSIPRLIEPLPSVLTLKKVTNVILAGGECLAVTGTLFLCCSPPARGQERDRDLFSLMVSAGIQVFTCTSVFKVGESSSVPSASGRHGS